MMNRLVLLAALALGACLDPGDPGNLVPRTVDQDPSLPQIEINGAKLHAEAFGDPDAPLVIALHGGPGCDYRSILALKQLADRGYRVVFWDHRGAGLSQRFSYDEIDPPGYLEDLRLVVEHYTTHPGQPLVFIGHSWGAMYATWFINEHGDYGGRVKGAILSEPGAFTSTQLKKYLDEYLGALPLTSEQLNDGTWSRQFMSPTDHARADYLSVVISYGGLPSEAHDPANPMPMWRYGAIVTQKLLTMVDVGFDWTTNLGAFRTKVLFLRGDKNTVATLEQQKALAAFYPNAELITLSDAGHELIWEQPDAYLEHTLAYFQQIGFAP